METGIPIYQDEIRIYLSIGIPIIQPISIIDNLMPDSNFSYHFCFIECSYLGFDQHIHSVLSLLLLVYQRHEIFFWQTIPNVLYFLFLVIVSLFFSLFGFQMRRIPMNIFRRHSEDRKSSSILILY